MARTLTPSGLVVIEQYGVANWWSTFNANMAQLNSTCLKLSSLADVNVTGLTNGRILSYDAATQQWRAIVPPARKPLSFS